MTSEKLTSAAAFAGYKGTVDRWHPSPACERSFLDSHRRHEPNDSGASNGGHIAGEARGSRYNGRATRPSATTEASHSRQGRGTTADQDGDHNKAAQRHESGRNFTDSFAQFFFFTNTNKKQFHHKFFNINWGA